MAGLGRKVFTRERATVADVQGYLMDQANMVFASASARDAAIPSAQATDGMVVFLKDQQVYEERINGAWRARPSNNAGTSGVLAGTAPPAGTYLREKTFFSSVVLNANGDGSVIYPVGAFANGVTAVEVQHVSQGGAPSNNLTFRAWNVGLASCNVRCYGPTGAVFGGTGVAAAGTIKGW